MVRAHGRIGPQVDTEGKRDSRLETYCEIRRIRAQESVKRLPTASLTDSWAYREFD